MPATKTKPKPRRGRPPLLPGPSAQVNVQLAAEIVDKLDRICQRDDGPPVSRSWMIGRLIELAPERRKRP